MYPIAASAGPEDSSGTDPITQLNSARRLVEERYVEEEPLIRAALHLIDCATGIVAGLPQPTLEVSREALGSARAAVVSATVAVGRIHDLTVPGKGSA